MAYGSGLGATTGVRAESAYGAYVAPDRLYQGEASLSKALNVLPLTSLGAGLIAPMEEVVVGESGSGSLKVPVLTTKHGLLLQHLFGTSVTPAQQAATAAYLQSHTWGDNFGKSLTVQTGTPNTAGTVLPYTGVGGKILSAEYACAVGQFLEASYEMSFQQVVDDESISAGSANSAPVGFPFTQMALKLGTYDSEAAVDGVKGVTLRINRGQDLERDYAGNGGLIDEPIPNAQVEVSGEIVVDVVNQADFLTRAYAHTSTSLVWEFVGATIASTYKHTIRFRLPKVYFDPVTPSVSGFEVQSVSVPFRALYDSTNGLVSAQYMSTDTAV